jgi:hypothetical protein
MRLGQSGNSMAELEDFVKADLPAPEQLRAGMHRCASFEGERRMLQEMLQDAIECWQSISALGVIGRSDLTSSRERLYREADFWIFGEYDNAPFFSFTETCDCLGLNADFIRRGLLEWRRKACRSLTAHADRRCFGTEAHKTSEISPAYEPLAYASETQPLLRTPVSGVDMSHHQKD